MPSNDPPPLYPGRVLTGVLLGIGCQVLTLVFSLIVISMSVKLLFAVIFWGVTQWLLIIPLALLMRSRGEHATVNGLLLMGFIGILLNSLCGAVFFLPSAFQPRIGG